MKNIFKEDREITSMDTDFNLEVKPSTLFMMFQELSSKHSEILKIGKAATIDKNLHWVITRFDVEIIRMPKYGEKVVVSTYPGDNNPIFFLRHYYIEDNKHNVLVKANSVWAIIDGNTHRVVKDPFPNLKLPVEHRDDELAMPNKIVGNVDACVYQRRITYSDIDLNKHLNNTRYVELIQDAFDLSFYEQYKLKRIEINYNAELKAGDEVKIYRSNENPYILSGQKDGKEHFIARLTFDKR